ncbi:MAG: prepilin-type N-terminal cleavage/methylation domain-containing protein [Solirubrobacterales bacterium]
MTGRTGVAARLRHGEDGFTMIELLVSLSLGLVVVAAALMVFVSGLKSEPRASTRAAGVDQARFVMERMTRELRQGTSVSTSSASQISMVTYVDSATCGGAAASTAILCRVTYNCSAGACTRTVAQPSGASPGPAVRVVSGLSNSSVFVYVPSNSGTVCAISAAETCPIYVYITLAFPARDGGNAITLNDGVGLRNS